MAKAHPKKQQRKKRPVKRASTKRRSRFVVELKPKEPRTVQKTVRVPTYLLHWLEAKSAAVRPDGISVPLAIVQLLEDAYQRDHAPKAVNG